MAAIAATLAPLEECQSIIANRSSG
jgi:hypothetical protein